MSCCNIGMDAELLVGAAGAPATDLTGLTEVDLVKDVTLNLTKSQVDVTTRGNAGWRSYCGGLKEATATVELLYCQGNTELEAIRDAFLNNTLIGAAIMTGPATVNREGLVGDWSVTDFGLNQPLEEGQTFSVTLSLQDFGAWLETTPA